MPHGIVTVEDLTMTTNTHIAMQVTRTEVERVKIAHGGGGELMRQLIERHIAPILIDERLAPLTDGAVVAWDSPEVVFTTDSFVVTPLEFPGADIGRLAVAGTVNDLAVMGARPVALSLAFILEEGLPMALLDRVVASIAATAKEANVEIVTGDTKVIERRSEAPGLFINTAGIGRRFTGARLGMERISVGDCIMVNGHIAEHGLAILSARDGLSFETRLRSDAAPLGHMIAGLLSEVDVKFLRDATRGGVAGVLADICDGSGFSVEIEEQSIPITSVARHASEMLGLDPLAVANEGKIICVVAGEQCEKALATLKSNSYGRNAACIGVITGSHPPLVEFLTRNGGRRIVQRPYGEELPRIC